MTSARPRRSATGIAKSIGCCVPRPRKDRVTLPEAAMSDDDYKPGLIGQIKDKLISSKQQWAKDGRLLTGEASSRERNRLPPGQRLVRDWPVLDLGVPPHILLDRWQQTGRASCRGSVCQYG